ncbi:hypothetical protein SARC_06363 [Sphaeroforma arctica JP610]|uniref:Calponin-homology (CH) domain-containing protein n=1 Tax=Sphaeroforma arctica JP610 TaxID=667725 RepID=A0A0L0FZB9_9EUKA|nr:hypothetical protein SARC_06363 [Sphaeroforma arctica JP610]KNC81313.1 hypothetical protein SARC_06363 [Sphaeroforma arctica JP610]|eukprot:XP_014155215.1 hypothetical protein SARC_06363 [Sphaeroforma arctica JP610]
MRNLSTVASTTHATGWDIKQAKEEKIHSDETNHVGGHCDSEVDKIKSTDEPEEDWVNTQRKVFTRWVNEYLQFKHEPIGGNEVLEDALADGVRLPELVEELKGGSQIFTRMAENRRGNKLFVIVSLGAVLEFLQSKEQVQLVNISAEDLYEKSTKLSLGLVWTLIRHYHIFVNLEDKRDSDEKNEVRQKKKSTDPKAKLLRQINRIYALRGMDPVSNFKSAFKDAKRFYALVQHLRSECPRVEPTPSPLEVFDDMARFNTLSLGEQFADTFRAAKEEFDIPDLLEADDFSEGKFGEHVVMTYLCYFLKEQKKYWKYHPKRRPSQTGVPYLSHPHLADGQSNSQECEVVDKTTDELEDAERIELRLQQENLEAERIELKLADEWRKENERIDLCLQEAKVEAERIQLQLVEEKFLENGIQLHLAEKKVEAERIELRLTEEARKENERIELRLAEEQEEAERHEMKLAEGKRQENEHIVLRLGEEKKEVEQIELRLGSERVEGKALDLRAERRGSDHVNFLLEAGRNELEHVRSDSQDRMQRRMEEDWVGDAEAVSEEGSLQQMYSLEFLNLGIDMVDAATNTSPWPNTLSSTPASGSKCFGHDTDNNLATCIVQAHISMNDSLMTRRLQMPQSSGQLRSDFSASLEFIDDDDFSIDRGLICRRGSASTDTEYADENTNQEDVYSVNEVGRPRRRSSGELERSFSASLEFLNDFDDGLLDVPYKNANQNTEIYWDSDYEEVTEDHDDDTHSIDNNFGLMMHRGRPRRRSSGELIRSFSASLEFLDNFNDSVLDMAIQGRDITQTVHFGNHVRQEVENDLKFEVDVDAYVEDDVFCSTIYLNSSFSDVSDESEDDNFAFEPQVNVDAASDGMLHSTAVLNGDGRFLDSESITCFTVDTPEQTRGLDQQALEGAHLAQDDEEPRELSGTFERLRLAKSFHKQKGDLFKSDGSDYGSEYATERLSSPSCSSATNGKYSSGTSAVSTLNNVLLYGIHSEVAEALPKKQTCLTLKNTDFSACLESDSLSDLGLVMLLDDTASGTCTGVDEGVQQLAKLQCKIVNCLLSASPENLASFQIDLRSVEMSPTTVNIEFNALTSSLTFNAIAGRTDGAGTIPCKFIDNNSFNLESWPSGCIPVKHNGFNDTSFSGDDRATMSSSKEDEIYERMLVRQEISCVATSSIPQCSLPYILRAHQSHQQISECQESDASNAQNEAAVKWNISPAVVALLTCSHMTGIGRGRARRGAYNIMTQTEPHMAVQHLLNVAARF